MARLTKSSEFPKDDHVAVLVKDTSNTYALKYEYHAFSDMKEFKEWVKEHPKVDFVPIVCKKLQLSIDVKILNLDEKDT